MRRIIWFMFGLLESALLLGGIALAAYGVFNERLLFVAIGTGCLVAFTVLDHTIEPCDCDGSCHNTKQTANESA